MATQTVTAALQAIPVNHPAYSFAQTALTKITVAAGSGAHATAARKEMHELLSSVVRTLMSDGTLPPASVLAGLTFKLGDCGVTGSMNVATVATVGTSY